jgi:hypothetical protein
MSVITHLYQHLLPQNKVQSTITIGPDGLPSSIAVQNLGPDRNTAGLVVLLAGQADLLQHVAEHEAMGGVQYTNSQSPAFAASYTPDLSLGSSVIVGTLSAGITVNNPTNVPPFGYDVTFYFLQNGTGGFAVAWGTSYIFATAWTNTGNTAGKRSQITFEPDPNGLLIARGANSWY